MFKNKNNHTYSQEGGTGLPLKSALKSPGSPPRKSSVQFIHDKTTPTMGGGEGGFGEITDTLPHLTHQLFAFYIKIKPDALTNQHEAMDDVENNDSTAFHIWLNSRNLSQLWEENVALNSLHFHWHDQCVADYYQLAKCNELMRHLQKKLKKCRYKQQEKDALLDSLPTEVAKELGNNISKPFNQFLKLMDGMLEDSTLKLSDQQKKMGRQSALFYFNTLWEQFVKCLNEIDDNKKLGRLNYIQAILLETVLKDDVVKNNLYREIVCDAVDSVPSIKLALIKALFSNQTRAQLIEMRDVLVAKNRFEVAYSALSKLIEEKNKDGIQTPLVTSAELLKNSTLKNSVYFKKPKRGHHQDYVRQLESSTMMLTYTREIMNNPVGVAELQWENSSADKLINLARQPKNKPLMLAVGLFLGALITVVGVVLMLPSMFSSALFVAAGISLMETSGVALSGGLTAGGVGLSGISLFKQKKHRQLDAELESTAESFISQAESDPQLTY